ncbi:MAG: radical SAM protein [Chloroflexi bacterium HGW-Chloroflexi-3]|nr:MAG: radical SAM protein [Chloroflexi bacterium HGW-Chloroflexi-3]
MNGVSYPSNRRNLSTNEFSERVNQALDKLEKCCICPLDCGVNRLENKKGVCLTGRHAQISSFGPHHGEEKPLSGWCGSGTIFFSRCNLHCVFCQNADISQEGFGKEVTADELSEIMLDLQRMGCHNINLVSPSHVVPQILEAIFLASQKELSLPIVYNCGGYDSIETLKLLDGVVDIYMPDMKYADEKIAKKYSRVPNYPTINQAAVLEMYRQVGDLVMDENGIAVKGLLVRHLIMPNGIAGTEKVIHFLAEKVSRNVYLNLMDQFWPAYQAARYPEINRSINQSEMKKAIDVSRQLGIQRFSTSL